MRYLAILVVACAASVVLSLVRCSHVAAPADFATVAEAVRAAYQPGDLIVVVPFHQATPRTLLGDLPMVELRHPEPEMLRLHARLLLIAVDAIGAGDLAAEVESLGAVTAVASAGRVRASLVTVHEPLRVTFELRENLRDVRVSAAHGGAELVGTMVANLFDGPRACVWMHPTNDNRELTLTLPEVAGSRLLLGAGFVLSAGHAPVEIDVRRDGARIGAAVWPARVGFQVTSVELGAGSGPVSLAVRTRDPNAFCANAWVVE